MHPIPYAQSTCESCLAVCLLQLSRQPITRRRELDILSFALAFSKSSFTIGHLEWIARKVGTKCELFLEDNGYSDDIEKIPHNPRIRVLKEKIDVGLLNRLITRKPAAVYVDSHAFWKTVHYPHFVLVLSRISQKYRVFDPWDGKTRVVTAQMLQHGLDGLRDRLGFGHQVIQLDA